MRTIAILIAALVAVPQQQAGERREVIQKCAKIARSSLVGLEIHLRKKNKIEKAESEEDDRSEEEQKIATLAENRQTLDTYATVIDANGTMLLAPRGLRGSDVEKIVGTAPDGTTFDATIEAIGLHYDFLVLKASKPPGGAVAAAFEAFEPLELGNYYYTPELERVDGRWHVNVGNWLVTNATFGDPKGTWFLTDRVPQGAPLFDSKGRLVGIPFDEYLWTAGSRDSFIGKNLVADERIPLKDLATRQEKLRKEIGDELVRIEFSLREENVGRYRDPETQAKIVEFGMPIDDQGTLFIAKALPVDQIRKTESITAPLKGEPRPVTFIGRFKDFGGMLVRVDGLRSKPLPSSSVKSLETGLLYHVVTVEDKFGRGAATAEPNRVFRMEKGTKGTFHEAFRRSPKLGSFVCGVDGAAIGFYAEEQKEEDLEQAAEDDPYRGRYRRYQRTAYLNRIYLFADMMEKFAKPEAFLDPKAVPVTKKAEKTLVWMGFEFQDLSKPLAQLLGVEDKELTNDGKRGLLVTDVYPDSPAAKLGLQPNDIVITVKTEGEAGKTIDLAPEERYGYDRGAAPWRPRKNYLTSLLTQIGAGKEVTVEYVRGKEKKSVKVKLEDGPTDFDTAEKHKDESLGVTIKALTYEVRYFQKLDAAATGVVVAKVESGSKAEVGKLSTLSIVTRVNDQPVKDPAHFAELLKASRQSAAKTLTLTVLFYGQTRLVDVDLSKE